jgi:hypothetical protein
VQGWQTQGACVYLRSVDGRFATEPFPIPSPPAAGAQIAGIAD